MSNRSPEGQPPAAEVTRGGRWFRADGVPLPSSAPVVKGPPPATVDEFALLKARLKTAKQKKNRLRPPPPAATAMHRPVTIYTRPSQVQPKQVADYTTFLPANVLVSNEPIIIDPHKPRRAQPPVVAAAAPTTVNMGNVPIGWKTQPCPDAWAGMPVDANHMAHCLWYQHPSVGEVWHRSASHNRTSNTYLLYSPTNGVTYSAHVTDPTSCLLIEQSAGFAVRA